MRQPLRSPSFSRRLLALALTYLMLAGSLPLPASAAAPRPARESKANPSGALTPPAQAAPAPLPLIAPQTLPANGKIAFRSNRDGNNEIYVMNPDGTAQTRLTDNPADDFNPSFSPDDSQIVFGSNRDSNNEIYVMNADGTGQIRLTDNPAFDEQPSFSPDGSKIAFKSGRDGNDEIYVMNADGTGQINLSSNPAFDEQPSFSPDGSKIVFTSDRDGNFEIYVMNLDGTGQINLTNNPGFDFNPSFNPNDGKIGFTSIRDGNQEVYVMNADGTGQTRLTNNPALDEQPSFSPDGSKIAFQSNRDSNFEIYVMNADGTSQTRLTDNPATDSQPSWGALVANQTITVSNTADSGAGSLRQAILDANAATGTQTIVFNIPGTGGVETITPLLPLPDITDPVVIDGYTQPGATPNTSSEGSDAVLRIQLRGDSAGEGANGLNIFAGGTTVRGLIISRFSAGVGIRLAFGAGGNVIEGNFIGTDDTGFESLPNLIGVEVNGSPNNTIGGVAPAARNVISGNSSSGVHLFGGGATGNAVRGNLIGTDRRGGTTDPLGNGQIGVLADATASNNNIGGTEAGASNVIAFSPRGVVIDSGTGNAVLTNSIFGNGALGIDLSPQGVTTNDAGDPDEGANNLQNFPLLSSAASSGANTAVQGALNSTPNTNFTVQFFANPACHSSGNGEGQVFLGSTNVTTDGNGDAAIDATLLSETAAGNFVTATATDANNNTSEFSPCVAVIAQTFTISGDITRASSECTIGLEGVTVTLSGDSSATTTTASDGSYQFTNLTLGGNYTVTPAGTYSQPSQTFSNLQSDQTANFCGTAAAPPSSFFVSNPATITIPDSGTATPYPSDINVSGLPGTVGKVTVTLRNLSHTFPADISVLLVSPSGQRMIPLSGAGGGSGVNNVTLTFDDGAAQFVPTPIVSGTYKPTAETGEGGISNFPAPAPAGPYGQTLSVFNGTAPNGTWSLYVFDGAGGDSGQIADGWSLSITPNTNPTCVAPPANMTAWYPGDGNANDIQGGNNGSLFNGATFAAGKVEQAFSFDGVDDFASFGNTVGNFGASDFTVDFWINSTSLRQEEVLGNRVDCSGGNFLSIRKGSGGGLSVEVDNFGSGYIPLNSTVNISDGAYHHIAVVRQGATLALYIDGRLDTSGTAADGIVANINNSNNFIAGTGSCGEFGQANFTGQLDEIEIFNRAISQTEIQSIFNADSAGKCKAEAAIQLVTNTNDSGAGSLRQAILNANAATGVQSINFNLPSGTQTITLQSQIDVTTDGVNIFGDNSNGSLLEISGGGTTRLFSFAAGISCSINGLTLRDGVAAFGGKGGAILMGLGTTLGLDRVVVTGNQAGTDGGAVETGGGNLTITNSTLSGNSTGSFNGGAIHGGGQIDIINSTLSGNTSGLRGGAIHHDTGTLTISNSTISGNTANDHGGGIAVEGGATANIGNATITNNLANADLQSVQDGGGIHNDPSTGGTITVANSIIAANNANASSAPDVFGVFTSSGYNLIGNTDSSSGFGQPGDLVGTGQIPLDPRLAPLASNGGLTQTHELLPDSPAIDAGNSALTFDQRSLTRPVDLPRANAGGGNGSDIGAFEMQAPPEALTVTNTADSGAGSLRQAILDANSMPGTQTINFLIDGGGVQTITPASGLPVITDSVIIDGYTQPGASPNTLATGNNAVLQVEITGTSPTSSQGLIVSGTGSSTIRGLVINRFSSNVAIRLESANNRVEGCFIGTTPAGNVSAPNLVGIQIIGSNNLVGGTTPAARNIISGNGEGVITEVGTNIQVQGNYIGTDLSGTSALPNSNSGVVVRIGAVSNLIGGTLAEARNVISGNGAVGVLIGGANANLVQGNYIGTAADGSSPLGNGSQGIYLASVSNCIIGGTASGAGNLIAFNGRDGIVNDEGTGNAILGNSIFSNGTTAQHLGINLGLDGVTPNDAGDADTGANNLQNFPVLTSAVPNDGIQVDGTLNSTPNTTFNIQFFASQTCDPSGNGEGQDLRGTATVTTDDTGNASFTDFISGGGGGANEFITATATDPAGNTSEFSACRQVFVERVTVTNTGDSGFGSLRQAILDSNALAGTQTINFDIFSEVNGVRTITPASALPTITDPVIIDGYTQPGASPNTQVTGNDAVLLIALDGVSGGGNGLHVTAGNSTVRGLIIERFGNGLLLETNGGNTIAGNFIGTDGTNAGLGNSTGVEISNSSNNLIGGVTPAARNVVSANRGNGLSLVGAGTTLNLIQGNYVGITANGTGALGNGNPSNFNGEFGVNIAFGASNNTIGGTVEGARNVISANADNGVFLGNAANNFVQGNFIGTDASGTVTVGGNGILIVDASNNTIGGTSSGAPNVISNSVTIANPGSTGNVVQGNFIGVASDGVTAIASNSFNGVTISLASNNQIGGTAPGAGNIIAFNGNHGVSISDGGTGNSIRSNRIFSNGGLGIDLGADNVTANDPGDADTGPNNLQNFPVLTSAEPNDGVRVEGTLNSTPNTQFQIEFFSNSACDASGNGEGQSFAGSTFTTTDESGNASFVDFISGGGLGSFITATATDPAGNTSEFSQCFEAMPPLPTLGNYPNTSVQLNGNTTVTPDAAPTNTARISVTTSTSFKGVLSGDPATGVVRVTDAHPAGTYTVTVTAFNNAGAATSKTFTLTVTTPAMCNPITFAPAANFTAGNSPVAVAVGDFNGDGNQDLASANTSSNDVSVLLGDGAGSFGAPTNFGVGTNPQSVAVGDFNGDGNQDLASANFTSDDVSVLLGNGAGGFGGASNFGAGDGAISVAVGDFNGDGNQDLATANQNASTVSILLGDGAGNFAAATNFGVGRNPYVVVVGDFNGDGKQDLATANFNSSNVSVLLGDGAGSFAAATNFGTAISPQSVTVGDFNGDGKLDLATANFDSNDVSVLLGDGAGSFAAATNFGAGTNPYSVAVGDFNGDGNQDLAVANTSSHNVSVLLGDGVGGFATAINFDVGRFPNSVAVGDFNGDGKPDITVTNGAIPGLSILLNNCTVPTGPQTFTVNTTDDADDGACNAAHCSLREAIKAANANAGATDTISFNIPGTSVHTIRPSSPLDAITDPVVIDGYTQPGAAANTLAVGNNAVLLIELDCANAGAACLNITAGNSTVRGLVINRIGTNGISISTNGGNTIAGNFIGTNAAGTAGVSSASTNTNRTGIYVDGSPNNVIGGTAPADRNLISGNQTNFGTSNGVYIRFEGSTGNLVQGNYVGTDKNGTANLGNSGVGVFLDNFSSNNTVGGTASGAGNLISGTGGYGVLLLRTSNNAIQGNLIGTNATGTAAIPNSLSGVGVEIQSTNNLVGGTTAAARNVISGNNGSGVEILDNGTTGNVVSGNFIGVAADGTTALGNTGTAGIGGPSSGVEIFANASNNTIGGTTPAAANVIAFNAGRGVNVAFGATGTRIVGNSIHDNASLGIDLGNDGVTPNDAGDTDTGANNLQNFPVLTSALTSGGTTTVQGTLNSTPSAQFTIEFFTNAACDAAGNGEGQVFLGSTSVTTDANGDAVIDATLSSSTSAGQSVTATATDAANNTSEFSACTAVTVPLAQVDVLLTKSDSPDPVTAGNALTYTITVNNGPAPSNTPEAQNVVVTDTLPSGVTFNGASSTQGSCTESGGTVTCNLGTLGFAGQAGVTINVTPTVAGTLSNTASVTSDNPDSNTANNTATASTVVQASSITVSNTADSGAGSLRQAIIDANNTAGPGVINFAIGTGTQTINLSSDLPAITEQVTVDGTTQPGYSGTPLITLNRTGGTIMRVSGGSNVTIKALALTGVNSTGIAANNCAGLVLQGNAIIAAVIGITINGGSDAQVLNNAFTNTGIGGNYSLDIASVTAGTLPKAIAVSGNTFTGGGSGLHLSNIANQVIGDTSVAGANVVIADNAGQTSLTDTVL
ncbi:MAG: FG-GAP-like repeat-containing protein, partial [Pyrinomonadaceae bacterium]